MGVSHRVLDNTGGGTGLTTTPNQELTIPFTTTATQTLQSSAGWVSGSVSITNTAVAAITLTTFTIDVGSGPAAQPLTQCQTTSVAVGGATSCAFNVSAPSAPAAGSVTAAVGYTPAGGSAATYTSTPTPYSFTGKAKKAGRVAVLASAFPEPRSSGRGSQAQLAAIVTGKFVPGVAS